jgi:hypothetical protein
MKTKTLFIALFFLMIAAAQAQDRYEYAVIDFAPHVRTMSISINGSEFKRMDPPKEQVKDDRDVSAALKEIRIMTMDGWEVFNTNTTVAEYHWQKSYIFYLRRKAR